MLIETQLVAAVSPETFGLRPKAHVPAVHVAAAGLAGSALAERFCFWRGRSGRRYVFSIYRIDAQADLEAELPRYADAIVIAAKHAVDGSYRIIDLGETGSLPELSPVIGDVINRASAADELHFHLLAGSAADRRAVLQDLSGASARRSLG